MAAANGTLDWESQHISEQRIRSPRFLTQPAGRHAPSQTIPNIAIEKPLHRFDDLIAGPVLVADMPPCDQLALFLQETARAMARVREA